MFILRTLATDKVAHNVILGDEYFHICRFTNYEEFKKAYKIVFLSDHVADLDTSSDEYIKNCCGFISYNKGSNLTPLYKDYNYYIMTDSGKTFEKL